MRRPVRAGQPRRYGPGGLPTEGVDPAPKVHPAAPWVALLLILGFLALQLYPATHFRHPKDPSRTWVPITRHESGEVDHQATWEEAHRTWYGYSIQDAMNYRLQQDRGVEEENSRLEMHQDVQIFISTDEKDLRPLAVVINSTIRNAKHPERLKFNLVIPASESKLEYYKLTHFFKEASIEIISEGIDLAHISELIMYRKESKARKELATPYNYVPYYLPQLLKDRDIDRIIYLDTDVVVKGDIEELYQKNLGGYPAAAARDCSQRLGTYLNFNRLEEIQTRENGSKSWLPIKPFDEEECVYNRGVLVIDVKRWIQLNVTETIEWWIKESNKATEKESNKAGKVLFTYGLSQPPFMLALYKNYKELELEWNVRGLGRDKFSQKELDFYAGLYERPNETPFVSWESDHAKVLHFNGKFKPWKMGRMRSEEQHVVSLCGEKREECYKLWWEYLNKEAENELK